MVNYLVPSTQVAYIGCEQTAEITIILKILLKSFGKE